MEQSVASTGVVIRSETRKLKREITLLPLAGLIYFTVSGGAFGVESVISSSGPLMALLLIFLTPIIFSIPNVLMVREMTSMMPVEGGYYHWIKQAFGPFMGFMAGWMNWVVAWVDVAIYPVLLTTYLSYHFPALKNGLTLGGIDLPGWLLSWLVALVMIWSISYLNIRGARLTALTTNWLGILMLLPLILLSILGIYQWMQSGVTISMPIIPDGQSWTKAFSVGLFVIMWNYMGWELPTAAGDEIVNPKKTYPAAMTLVLVAAIATYALPTLAGLYGGAADNSRYMLWGLEEANDGDGIGIVLSEAGVTTEQMDSWGIDPSSNTGWGFPEISQAVGDKVAGKGSILGRMLGTLMSVAAVLSMIGLFIGNSLGGTRIPFAMAEDGMMPNWLVKVHPRYGTPWIAIIFCGIIFSVFTLNAFSFLAVIDVFLNVIVLMICFFALWRLRFSMPDLPRQKVPGGLLGLTLVTLGPAIIIGLAIYSQIAEEGLSALWLALAAILIGALIYYPIRRYVKPGIPDINPFEAAVEEI